MAYNTDKENWINETLNSVQGVSRAAPEADLFDKIIMNLGRPETIKTVALPVKQWAAAAILLLALNIGSVLYFSNGHKKAAGTVVTTNPLAAAMQAESTYSY